MPFDSLRGTRAFAQDPKRLIHTCYYTQDTKASWDLHTIAQVPASILGALFAVVVLMMRHGDSIIIRSFFRGDFYVTDRRQDTRHHFLVPRSWSCLSR